MERWRLATKRFKTLRYAAVGAFGVIGGLIGRTSDDWHVQQKSAACVGVSALILAFGVVGVGVQAGWERLARRKRH